MAYPLYKNDNDAGVTFVGSWTPYGALGYGGDEHFSNTPGDTATYAITGLTTGVAHTIALCWPASGGDATNNTVVIKDGGTTLGTFTLDQQPAPTDFTSGGALFQYLPSTFTPSGTTLTVIFTVGTDGFGIADAVQLDLLSNITTYPTAQVGDWATGSTWKFGVVPAGAITAVINHNITINTTVSIGDGTAVSFVQCLGGLPTINGTLTVRGNLQVGTPGGIAHGPVSTLTIAAGGTLLLDGNSAVTPNLFISAQSNVICSGSSGSHCVVRTKSGLAGNNALIGAAPGDAGIVDRGHLTASFTDFTGLGDITNAGLTADLQTSGATLQLHDCTVNACGQFPSIEIAHGAVICSFLRTKWLATVSPGSSYCAFIHTGAVAMTGGGVREIQYCVFDATDKPQLHTMQDFTINHNVFFNTWQTEGDQSQWASFSDNFSYEHLVEESSVVGSVDSCYFLYAPVPYISANGSILIPHHIPVTFSNCRFERDPTNGDTQETFIGMSETGTVDRTVTFKNCVADMCISDSFHNPNDVGSPTVVAEHCTIRCWSAGAIVQHTNGSPGPLAESEIADQLLSARANILWSAVSSSGWYAIFNHGGESDGLGIVVDSVHAANADYNCCHNLNATPNNQWTDTTGITPCTGATNITSGTPYNSPMSGSTVPGAHDVTVDPQFVDSTRGVVGFDTHMGGPGTLSNALLKLAAQYDSTNVNYVSGYTTAALLAWTMAGFVPNNSLLNHYFDSTHAFPGDTATTDALGNSLNGTIGALAYAAAADVTTFTLIAPSPANGDVTTASSDFTVTPNGAYTGTITLTPSGGGLSTPIVLTFTGSATPQTFTITPIRFGTVTITPTNSGSLTNPSPVTYLSMVQLGKSGMGSTSGGAAAGNIAPALGGFNLFAHGTWLPEFTRDVTGDAVDPTSAAYIALFPSSNLHTDFSATASSTTQYGGYGIPFCVVPGTQTTKVVTAITYWQQSDVDQTTHQAAVPVPDNPNVEGRPGENPTDVTGDQHILILVRNETTGGIDTLWEMQNSRTPDGGATWTVDALAKFDLTTGRPRLADWLSAEAAGTSIFLTLLRYEDVASGDIGHAIRVTITAVLAKYVWPARCAGSGAGNSVPYGARFRLNDTWYQVNKSTYSGQARVILDAMHKYGMMVQDVGGSFFFGGVTDDRWDPDGTTHGVFALQNVPVSAFEAIVLTQGWSVTGPTSGPVGAPATFTVAKQPAALDSHYQGAIYYDTPVSGLSGDHIFLGDDSIGCPSCVTSGTFDFTPPSTGVYTVHTHHGNQVWFSPPDITFTAGSGITAQIGHSGGQLHRGRAAAGNHGGGQLKRGRN